MSEYDKCYGKQKTVEQSKWDRECWGQGQVEWDRLQYEIDWSW